MRTQQDDHHNWYYLGIISTVVNAWILPQPIPLAYLFGATCFGIGLFGGLEPAYTTIYDYGQRALERLPAVERKLALIAVSVAIPLVRSLHTKMADLRADIEWREQVNNFVDEFVDAANALGMYVPGITTDDREAIQTAILERSPEYIKKPLVYPVVADQVYGSESPRQIEIRLVLLYTYKIDQATEDRQKSLFRREIDQYLTSVSFHPLDDEGERLLSAFLCLRELGWQETTPGAVFEREADISDTDIERFVKRYTHQELSTYLMRSKKQAEEFRQTLAGLVRHGRVQLKNLTEDIIQEKLNDAKQ